MAFENRNISTMVSDAEVVLSPFEISTKDYEEFRGTGTDVKAEISAMFETSSKRLLTKLRAWVAMAKHDEQFETYYFPKNAWQCLVHDYAPTWYIARFPVKYTELKVRVVGDVYVCPHHEIPWRTGISQHLDFIHHIEQVTEGLKK